MRGDVQVWLAPHRSQLGRGWLGVFNRNPARREESLVLTADRLGLPPHTQLHDIWAGRELGALSSRPHLKLPPLGCVFLEYSGARQESDTGSPEHPSD
jgi:hypothetical protein